MDGRGCFVRSMYADGTRKGCSSVVYLIRTRGARQLGEDGGGGRGGGAMSGLGDGVGEEG